MTELKQDNQSVTVSLSGVLAAQYVDRVIPCFREAISAKKQIVIDPFKVAHDRFTLFWPVFNVTQAHAWPRERSEIYGSNFENQKGVSAQRL